MPYLCSMYYKILCMALAFAISLSVAAEDLQSVMKFYKPDMSKGFIFVSKVDMTLTLVNSQGKVVVTYPIACGMNLGQKNGKGDHRTPEGYFLLEKIHDSSNWGHDFHDGKGFIKHAYGHYFLRLQTGFSGIGIHGTHAPIGMPVIIGPEEGVAHLIASNAKRPDLPYWTTGKARPAKPAPTPVAQKRKPKVVDGELDIDPEKDLIDAGVETPVKKAAPKPVVKVEDTPVPTRVDKPAKGPVFVKHDEKPAEAKTPVVETQKVETPVVETPKVETKVVETPVVETPVVETPKVETPVVETPKVETPVVETPVVETPKVETPVVETPVVESTDQAPQYDVVVDEVVQPDGTVKYVVRYVKK